MNKEKQIEEMGEYIAEIHHLECARKSCEDCKWCGSTNPEKADCTDYLIAEGLYNAGYRKASEVAEEFAEGLIKKFNDIPMWGKVAVSWIEEYLNKYTEDEG